VLWALTDHLGSVRDVVDSNGDLRIHRGFDSFGNVVDETHYNAGGTAVTAGQAGFVDEAFGFTGRWFDADTGLQNNLHRWYDPRIGRWLSEDPIGFAAGDANLYRYVGNEPTMRTDPAGVLDGRPGWGLRRSIREGAAGAVVGAANVGQKLWAPFRWLGFTKLIGIEGTLQKQDKWLDDEKKKIFHDDDSLGTANEVVAWGTAGAIIGGVVAPRPKPPGPSEPPLNPLDDPEHVLGPKRWELTDPESVWSDTDDWPSGWFDLH
jgi:RHS repeat-associated protein